MVAPPEGPLPRIGRYELVGEIATGGMAVVYLARLAGAGGFRRLFALKRLHRHLARETEFVSMFLDEARLAASVHSAHVVPILEVGLSEQNDHFVVMDYIEGASLAALIAAASRQQGRVPESVALRVTLDALEGLHAAHEAKDESGQPLGIVHRDVSPHNLLVGVDGVARLTDFGIARAASRLSSTRDGTFKGKLSYMAPEQAGGENVDRRADVFAAAVIAWELLANRRLFKGTNDLHTVHLLLYDRMPRLSEVRPGVPAALDEALARALDRDPAGRFATAAEFGEAIERAVEGWSPRAPARDLAAFVESHAAEELSRQRELLRANAGLPGVLCTVEHPLYPPEPAPSPTPAVAPPVVSSQAAARVSASQAAARVSASQATARVSALPAAADVTSTAEAQAALRGGGILPRLAALGIGAALASIVVFGYMALRGGERQGGGAVVGAPPAGAPRAPVTPEQAAPMPERAPVGTPALVVAPSALPEVPTGPSASASASEARPPKPRASGAPRPTATPAETANDEYPGLNPYRLGRSGEGKARGARAPG